MHSRRSALARLSFLLQFAVLLLIPCSARERGPRVEIACPLPPIAVSMAKNKVLVYELHVTNFDTVPLTLQHVEVFANQENGSPVFSLAGGKLTAAMTRIGTSMSASNGPMGTAQDTTTIDPGRRNVIFLWVELPVDGPVPMTLEHRLTFSLKPSSADGARDTTLEDFQVAVSQDSVPKLSPPFSGGIWVAGDGPVNDSNHRRSIFAIDGHTFSPERFAIDWVKVGPNGDSRHDGTTKNANWWGWGEPVLAVADGEVTEAVDEFPDNTPRVLHPVTLDNIAGNHIILRIAPNRFVTYAHLQRGTIKVR